MKKLIIILTFFGVLVGFNLAYANWSNVQIDSNGNYTIAQNVNASGTITVAGVAVQTSSVVTAPITGNGTAGSPIALNRGAYTALDGSNNLTVSSTLASSSVTFVFPNATTTKPQSFEWLITPNQKTITYVDCGEYAAATTTIELGYATTTRAATAGTIGQVILSSLACNINAASTTSFTTSTLPSGSYLIGIVSSTAGTPTLTDVNVDATKL